MTSPIRILIPGILLGLLGACRHHYQPIPEDFGCQQGKMTASQSLLGTEGEKQTIENPFGTLAILRDTTQWRGAFISDFETFVLQYAIDTSDLRTYDPNWNTQSLSQKQAYIAEQKKEDTIFADSMHLVSNGADFERFWVINSGRDTMWFNMQDFSTSGYLAAKTPLNQ